METEAGGVAGLGIEFDGAVAAVFEEFNAGQGRAEADVEGTPMTGFVQGGAQAADGVAEEANGRHAGEQATVPQDKVCMQVTVLILLCLIPVMALANLIVVYYCESDFNKII